MRILEEEENLVDNILILKKVNDPVVENIKKLHKCMSNISIFLKIIINSRNFMNNSDISSLNIPKENLNFIVIKTLNEFNNFSRFLDKFYNALKDKINLENNALDEKTPDEDQNSFNFLFKIKVSLTLKNHNNEMIGSLNGLIQNFNGFFSIIFQICQVNPFFIININLL